MTQRLRQLRKHVHKHRLVPQQVGCPQSNRVSEQTLYWRKLSDALELGQETWNLFDPVSMATQQAIEPRVCGKGARDEVGPNSPTCRAARPNCSSGQRRALFVLIDPEDARRT